VSLRLDLDLEWDIEYWRDLQPERPSRSRAIRQLIKIGLTAAEKEREDASKNSG
jgi:hypothetical protein